MTDIAIRVEGLGKQYRIGKTQQYDTLRDRIQAGFSAPFRKVASLFDCNSSDGRDEKSELFWALKDVSFEVLRGSVLGVIGRNGAGKSTLLKILSRITEPTEGRAEIHGRVASLLEVGTGFSGELSGRDNIFLNGAILGMKRAEIRRKFDEIVAFAEVENFIDTAVKFYSSGMYVRLAFAVAAHLEPEILIVDEVLAVGDAQFQKKCLGKMKDVSAKDGRTVLFVSHNLAAFRQLCTDGLLLEAGEVTTVGSSNEVADNYLHKMLIAGRSSSQLSSSETGYTQVRLINVEGVPVTSMLPDERAFIELSLRITRGSSVQAGFTIYNQFDIPLVLCASEYGGVDLRRGEQRFRVRLPNEFLQPGIYRVEGAVWEAGNVFHQSDYLCHFQVMPARSRELQGRQSSAQFILREPWIAVSGATSSPRTMSNA